MRRSKAEVERYIASVQSSAPSPREKSMKGFFFAKLYYEAKEYELAKRYISSYLDVQERDPKALKFLGHLYEVEGLVDKAVGCYKSSVELNPTQKDLVLKIAELLCDKNVDDGRAEYWVERASKLFPGSPAVYKLKEKLLNFKGDVGWNQLFDLIQSELYTRPDDVYVNIRLVELYRTNKRMEEAVNHCLNAEKKGALRTSLEWCTCVVHVLKEYLKSFRGTGPDKSMWRMLNKELLLAHCNLMLLSLSSKDVQECRQVFQSFDQTLQALKQYATGTDDLSIMFMEMRGQFYMHAGTLLLKMAQNSEAQWRAVTEPAALCYLIAFQVPKPKMKSIKGSENEQDLLEMLACDRLSQSGHMLCNLSLNKEGFLKGVVETFANKSGRSVLVDVFFENKMAMEQSFLGSDDICDIDSTKPKTAELARYDNGSIRLHKGNLHHLAWLGLQYHMSSPPEIRKWLKQLFPRLPQETPRLNTNAPESICILDLEIFLLGVIFTSNLQLQNHFNINYHPNQPKCLPLPVCTSLSTERQKSWWDAVYNLIHKKAQPGASAKLRLLLQHELITLRALEKHGLQPAVIIHWARNLHKTGSNLNSYYDQKDYMVRCVHYWKKILPLLDHIKQKKNIPEPIDPLFKHFHSQDIQIHEVSKYEEEARIAFASLDVVDGRFDDAIRTFDEIKNVVSYWNLARIFQRKAEDIKNDAISEEEQEECTNCLQKSKMYLSKIIDESFADSSVAEKLPVSLETVKKMLDSVLKELGEYCGEDNSVLKDEASQIDEEIKLSTQTPTKFSISPNKSYKLSPKTPPAWVEDQRALIQMLCHQVEVLNNEVRELKLSYSGNVHSSRWPSEGFGTELMPDSYQGTPSFHGTPLTVSTQAAAGYYNQAPAYNSKYLLRTATSDTPAKAPLYGGNQLASQPHMYAYQQPIPTPPVQSASSKFPREAFGASVHYGSPGPGLLSPRSEDYYSYSAPKTTANPPLPEPGYFTKPTLLSTGLDSKIEELGKVHLTPQTDSLKIPPFINTSQDTPSAFKFTSNFQSNEGDFAFSTPQFVPPNTAFSGSESLFSLLTSDTLSLGSHTVQKASVDSQESMQKNLFNFGQKHFSGPSLNENGSQNLDKTSAVFDKGYPTFNLKDTKKLVFETQTVDASNVSQESDGGVLEASDDDGPHFEPVIPLPDKVDVKTGEEEEEELFSNRAKLFRFDTDLKEWKERGVGIVKFLRHKKSDKVRLLMRREQVLKICANHYISPNMTLKLNAGSNKSYVWHALDYADEMPKPEQFAIRFKTPGEAQLFKQKFEEVQKHLKESSTVRSPPQQSAEASHQPVNKVKGNDKSSSAGATFEKQSSGKLYEWICNGCMVRNPAKAPVCVSCQAPPPSKTNKVIMAPVKDTKTGPAVASGVAALPTFSFGMIAVDPSSGTAFGGQFTKKQGEWDCDVCLLRNAATTSICVACQSSHRHAGGEAVTTLTASSSATLANMQLPQSFSFSKEPSAPVIGTSNRSRKKKGPWVCRACSASNEAGAKICGSCGTTVTTVVPGSDLQVSVNTVGLGDNSSSLKSDFGARFSRKQGQWDCSVCMVRNEASSASCASCLTCNPQVASATTVAPPPVFSFKFGTSSETGALKPSGFGSESSKKEGQWKCKTCLVKNDASLGNCAACQTPNPCAKSGPSSIPPSSALFGLKSKFSELTGVTAGTESKCASSESSFAVSEHLGKKKGEWHCSVCLVVNKEATKMCAACQTPFTTSTAPRSSQMAPSKKSESGDTCSSGKVGFGARFSIKDGQWDCNMCLVRNEASSVSCVSCLTPNPQATPTTTVTIPPAPSFKFGSSTGLSSLKPSSFGSQFSKREGQWDCSVCLVRNEAFSVSCVACFTPNPQATPTTTVTKPPAPSFKFGSSTESSTTKPSSFCQTPNSQATLSNAVTFPPDSSYKFGSSTESSTIKPSSFGSQFSKRDGQWDCNVCLVRNEASSVSCASCLTPNPQATPNNAVTFPPASSFKFGSSTESGTIKPSSFGSQFSKKEGQWDCNVCLVRNEASSLRCVSCLAIDPKATPSSTTVTFPSAPSFTFGSSTESSTLKLTGFGSQFSKTEGQWDCNVCLVRNKPSVTNCAACQAPNPSSALTFGLKNVIFETKAVQSETLSNSAFPGSNFQFGLSEQEKIPSSILQTPSFNSKSDPVKKGFAFSVPSGGFKFGIHDPPKNDQHNDQSKELTATVQKVPGIEVNQKPSESATLTSLAGSIKPKDIDFGQKITTFTDLATSSDSQIQKNVLNFKGISQMNTPVGSEINTTSEQEKSDELYQTEDRDDIHFEPVVQLPEKVELVTGEEGEKELYSERVKLFRFDADTSQWKERGVGSLKILRNERTGALRLLMRRDQVLKVCANHWITTSIKLKPLSGSDRAWMWLASDFSDGDVKLEQLAAKFKNSDQAQDFKFKFEESQKLLLDQPVQTPGSPSKQDSSKQVNKQGKPAICDFITEQRGKHHEKDTKKSTTVIVSPSIEVKPVSECSKSRNDNFGGKTSHISLGNEVSLSPASDSVKKSLFSFGDAAAGFNFSFQPVLSPSKSPNKLNHSRVSVGTDEESDTTQEEDRDGPYFEPVVPLPDLVEVSSGEENEQVLFRNRAKLYRFDKEANQWKERGIGDMKILQNSDTKAVRVLMRRDQVLKLCANHRITSDMNLKPMTGMDRAWIWTAHDFAEGEGKTELFAVRFKLQDVADSFYQAFSAAKQAQEDGTLLSPLPLNDSPLKATLCGKQAVAVLEETTRERTDVNQEDSTTAVSPVKSEALDSSEKQIKNFISPPKLVFGSDSVKNIFSSEKTKSFAFGSTTPAGSLFGFSFNPLPSGGEKNSSVTHNITAKRLDFSKGVESSKFSTISHTNTHINPLKSSTLEASSEKETLQMLKKDKNRKGEDAQLFSDDVVFVYELSPTPEQRALAESLQLPPTFFCYKSRPHYESDDDHDDEDFETAVKKLNGQLYPEYSASVSSNDQVKGADGQADVTKELVSESLKSLHLSSFGVTHKDTCSQELIVTARAFEESRQEEVSSSTDTTYPFKLEAPKPTISFKEEEDSNTENLQTFLRANNAPEALSTKFQNPDSTFRGLENFDQYGFSSSTGQSFADLASTNSGNFAFGNTDKNFSWQNSGAVLFSSQAASKDGDNEDDDGEDAAQNEDVHFEPIVSLVEVEVKSGEEDEEVLFKERAKLYRWDRDVTQWKERGEGEIKILFHPEKKFYRVLMRRDQIFKVCANHVLSTSMDIQPLASSNNALVWTAVDYSDGEGRAEQFAVRFKTQEMADSFKKTFQECQQNLQEVTAAS
ncbi:E3 SUMO-protein ligase RanBP2-like [Lissotriton helveticus]